MAAERHKITDIYLPAAIRWKNGDRQFISTQLVGGHARDEIMWKIGANDGGGHTVDNLVLLRLLSLNGSTAGGRLIYVEYP